MRTIQTNVFTAAELKQDNPSLFKKAHERYNDKYGNEIDWQREIFESLKGCIEASGLRLSDWDLGMCNRNNHIKVSGWDHDEVMDLCGARAIAWLENNLFGKLRPSWRAKNRWEQAKYNQGYRSCHPAGSDVLFSYFPGVVPPCPFTGYCADEDYIQSLIKSIKSGDSLKEAYNGLADTYVELLEAEYEHQQSEEYFLDTCSANGYEFDEDGDMI